MTRAHPLRLVLTLLFVVCAIIACGDRELRGQIVQSRDGRTYLVVDANGGQCGQVTVDGQLWPHALHVPGEIAPGRHRIACGDSGPIEFTVPSGTTFHFDYWGP